MLRAPPSARASRVSRGREAVLKGEELRLGWLVGGVAGKRSRARRAAAARSTQHAAVCLPAADALPVPTRFCSPLPPNPPGGIKRWGFARGNMTHGSKSKREHGSTGPGSTPGRVFPGLKAAGQMGNKRSKLRKVEVS